MQKSKEFTCLLLANKELAFQNTEKENRAAELLLANIELVFQNEEKGKREEELITANQELQFQNQEKEKRAAELLVANLELIFQNEEKEKRAAELIVANRELLFQRQEKAKRADELIFANQELKRVEEYQKEYIIGLEKMLYKISHEVRQPIAHLLGLSGLLDKIQTSGTLQKLLNYVKQSITALDTYTRDLTNFAANLVRKEKEKK